MTYWGDTLDPPTNECHVRPDGRVVTAYSSALVGPEGATIYPRTMLLWEWEPENGGKCIASCHEGDAEPLERRI